MLSQANRISSRKNILVPLLTLSSPLQLTPINTTCGSWLSKINLAAEVALLLRDTVVALITCPECSKQISSAATQCPSCGFPLPRPDEPRVRQLRVEVPSVTEPASVPTQSPHTHVIVHSAPQDWHGLAKASWILIAVACLISIIPVLGFASWLIAGPIFIATFVMAIMILSRGGTFQGLLLLGVSMFAAPAFVICAPFISSMLGLAGVGAAIEHSDQSTTSRQPTRHQVTAYSPPVASVQPAATQQPPKQQPVSEAQLIGMWQGKRHTTTFFPDHTFKQNGLYLPEGMKWRLDGNKLTKFYPDLGDKIPAWWPGAGPLSTTVISANHSDLITQWQGNYFVEYRIKNDSRSEIDSAATRAEAEQRQLNGMVIPPPPRRP